MDVLCVRFSALAFTGIETLMANSLVPFATPANDSNSHNFSSKIVAHLGQSFGYEADPFLRSHAEIAATVAGYHFSRRPPPTPPPPLTSIFSRPSRQSFDRAASEPIARRMTRSSCMAATTSGSAGGSNRTSQKSGPRQKSRTCNCPHHRCETLPPSEKTRPSALRRGPETVRTETALGHRAG
jgi:hypothetical protein